MRLSQGNSATRWALSCVVCLNQCIRHTAHESQSWNSCGWEYKGIAKTCRDTIRKAKAPLHLKLVRGVRAYKNEFLSHENNKEKQKEIIGLLSNKRGELVLKNVEKVLSTFTSSGFTSIIVLITKIQADAKTDVPSTKEDLVCEQELAGPRCYPSKGVIQPEGCLTSLQCHSA